jgi:hypothetical protein
MLKIKLPVFFAVLLVLLVAASVRLHSFYLPHNSCDQLFYLGLAMKLDNYGLEQYNLRGIDIRSDGETLGLLPVQRNETGSLQESLERENIFYYSRENISTMPPAYSYLLMLSRKSLRLNKYYLAVDRNLGAFALRDRPQTYLAAQFYATWINFALSLLFILTVFLLGKSLFNESVGLWASLFVAISSVDILTSQRLWADEMLSFFTAACVLFYWLGSKRGRVIYILASGICAGIASLAKQSGLFLIPVIVVFAVSVKAMEGRGNNLLKRIIFDRDLVIFLAGALCMSVAWYAIINAAYGAPWHISQQPGIEKVSPWFSMLNNRPRLGQLYYFVYLTPVFILFYFELARIVWKRAFDSARMLLLSWFFVFVVALLAIKAKEERYLLPVYPVIAIFSAVAFERLRSRLNRYWRGYAGTIAIIVLFCLAAVWSIAWGLDCVFSNRSIFPL